MNHFEVPEDMMDVIYILKVLYATEAVSAFQYWNHYYSIRGPLSPQLQGMLKEHAEQEYKHQTKLGEMIMHLGGEPPTKLADILTFSRHPGRDVMPLSEAPIMEFAHSDNPIYAPVLRVVTANLAAEDIAVEMYQEAVRTVRPFNAAAANLCEQLLAEEMEHAHELRNLLMFGD